MSDRRDGPAPTPDNGEPAVAPRRFPGWRDPVLPTGPSPTTPGGGWTVKSGAGLRSDTLVGPGHRVPLLYGRCLISPDLVKARPEVASGVTRGRYHAVISEGPIDAIESWAGATTFQSITTTLGSLSPTSGMPSWAIGLAAANILTKGTQPWFPQCIARGRLLYDPRLGAWGAGVYPDPTKCAYGKNPALVMADLLCFPQYGRGVDPSLVDWSSVEDAADWCDELVSGEARYEVNLYLQDARSAAEWEETIGLHAGLRWRQEAGLFYLDYSAPVTTAADPITADQVVQGSEPRMSYGGGAGLADRPNRFRAEWIDPASGWSVRTVEIRLPEVDAGAAIRDAEVYRLHGFQSEAMALRALWRLASEIASEQELEVDLTTERLDLVEGMKVPVTLASLGLSAVDFLVTSIAYDTDRVRATLRRYDPNTWTAPGSSSGDLPGTGFFDVPPAVGFDGIVREVLLSDTADQYGNRTRVVTYDYGATWLATDIEDVPFPKCVRLKWGALGNTPPCKVTSLAIEPLRRGSGYTVGDPITVVGGVVNATAVVETTTPSGGILSTTLTNEGSGYDGVAAVVFGGSGTGAKATAQLALESAIDWDDPFWTNEVSFSVDGDPAINQDDEGVLTLGFTTPALRFWTRTVKTNATGVVYSNVLVRDAIAVIACVETMAGLLSAPSLIYLAPYDVRAESTYGVASGVMTANALTRTVDNTLTDSKFSDDGTTPTYDGNTLWHAGNDGAASGLDADTVDGSHASAFAGASHTHGQSEITNLVSDLAAKAPLASPALTGTPTAPTATAGTNTTQIATTAFVQTALAGAGGKVLRAEAFLASGTWTAPTGVTEAWITACAGGGGGGKSSGNYHGGGGGGAAAFVLRKRVTVSGGTGYTVTIGAGGNGATGTQNAQAGGTTSFGALLSLSGGAAGGNASSTQGGAAGARGGEGGTSGQQGSQGTNTSGGTGGVGGIAGPGGWGSGGGGAPGQSNFGFVGGSGYVLVEWNE